MKKSKETTSPAKKKRDGTLIALWIIAGTLALGLVVFGAVMAIRAIYGAYLDTGDKYRNDVIFESEHHTLNAAMLSYRYHENIRSGVYGTNYTDPELLKQTASPASGMSLYEYYERILCESLLRDMRYAENASSNGVTLSEEELAWISARLRGIERSVTANADGKTLDDCLSAVYGRGVKMRDIEDLLRLEALSKKQRANIELSVTATDEELADYLSGYDLSVYLRTDYYIVDFGSDILPTDTSAEKAIKEERAFARAKRLSEANNEEEFVLLAKELLRQEYENDDSITDKDISEILEEDHYTEKEIPAIRDDDPASTKWLFSADRRAGDILAEADSPTVYFVASPRYSIDAPNDAYLVIDIGYDHYESRSAALAALNKILDLYETNKTEASFRSLARAYAENPIFRAHEGYYDNTAVSSSFNALLSNFKEAREADGGLTPGTTGTLYGEDGAYFVYYLGKGKMHSEIEAREELISGKCYLRYTELAKLDNIVYHGSKTQRSADPYKK